MALVPVAAGAAPGASFVAHDESSTVRQAPAMALARIKNSVSHFNAIGKPLPQRQAERARSLI
jgi:hypothetical protein